MARKKLKLGKATTRKATAAEMTRHKATVESSIQKGEVSRENVERSKRKEKTKVPFTPVVQEKKKTGIAAFRERDTFAGKAVKAATSLKTTATLGIALATLTGIGAIAGGARAAIAGTGTITRTGILTQGALRGLSKTTQRAIVGKPATTGVTKLFSAASRFATNTKSTALTKGFMIKLGLGLAGANLAVNMIGTYPFSAFGKEEALQAFSFAMAKAIETGNFDEAEQLLADSNTLISEVPSKIPYKNSLDSFNDYAKAQLRANEAWALILESKRTELNETNEFAESQENARQTKLEERERDSQYFALIREGKFDEAEELLQSELKGGNEK